jgi:hypothetical protein
VFGGGQLGLAPGPLRQTIRLVRKPGSPPHSKKPDSSAVRLGRGFTPRRAEHIRPTPPPPPKEAMDTRRPDVFGGRQLGLAPGPLRQTIRLVRELGSPPHSKKPDSSAVRLARGFTPRRAEHIRPTPPPPPKEATDTRRPDVFGGGQLGLAPGPLRQTIRLVRGLGSPPRSKKPDSSAMRLQRGFTPCHAEHIRPTPPPPPKEAMSPRRPDVFGGRQLGSAPGRLRQTIRLAREPGSPPHSKKPDSSAVRLARGFTSLRAEHIRPTPPPPPKEAMDTRRPDVFGGGQLGLAPGPLRQTIRLVRKPGSPPRSKKPDNP